MEVGREQLVVRDREPLVDGPHARTVGADERDGAVHRRVPAEDRPASVENRNRAPPLFPDWLTGRRCVPVEDGAGRPACDGDGQRRLRPDAAVQRRGVGAVVRRPPRRRRPGRQAPAVDERRVGRGRRRGARVRDQWLNVEDACRGAPARRACNTCCGDSERKQRQHRRSERSAGHSLSPLRRLPRHRQIRANPTAGFARSARETTAVDNGRRSGGGACARTRGAVSRTTDSG